MRVVAAILVSIVSFLAPSSSRAALTPVHLEGQVSVITSPLFYGLSSLGVVDGTTVDVTIIVDTSTPDSLAADPTRGSYVNSVTSFSVTAGSWSATTMHGSCCQSTIAVVNQNQPTPSDYWSLQITSMNAPDSPAVLGSAASVSLFLTDPTHGTTITSDSILPPSVGNWYNDMIISDPNGAYFSVAITSTRVPEPSTLAALGAATLAFVVGVMRARRLI
jgi:hypothetical protein